MMRRMMLAFLVCVAIACAGNDATTTATSTALTTAPVSSTAAPPPSGATTTEAVEATTTSGAPAGEVVDVFAEDFAFAPAEVTVRVGDSVRWNLSSGSHTTTSGSGTPDGRWDQAIAEENPVVITFAEAGIFPYYCRFHSDFMSGRVVVEP